MDHQAVDSETGGCSMVESSNNGDDNDIPDLEADGGLAPVTRLLDNNLTIQEDNPPATDVKMGIQDVWADTNNSTSSRAIPLPPPSSYSDCADVGVDSIEENDLEVKHGPSLAPSSLNNLFADSTDIQEEPSHEINIPAGVCGLRNLGNTCFMAAGLQSLTATPPVLRHFLEIQDKDEKLASPESLMTHFSSLLSKMWSGKYRVIQPTEFKRILGACHSQFKDYRQHDCQEFLALLLDSLHEQMNTAKSAKSYQAPATITTANSINTNNFSDTIQFQVDSGRIIAPISSFINVSTIDNDDLMDTYDNSPLESPDCLNSPNATMAGSPKGLDSLSCDLDSTANSPVNDDEETIDSEDTLETNSSFIYNKTCGDEIPVFEKARNFDDIMNFIPKTAKISNANILVTQTKSNNEIHYDSQKFPKDNLRRTTALDNSNLTENHDFDSKNISIKRIKEVNIQKNNCNLDGITNNSDTECDNNGLEKCNVKRMKLEDNEKNFKYDTNNILQSSKSHQNNENCGAIPSQDDIEADKHWEKHLSFNQSVIVDTFQGQFKSTVVCVVCGHVSVTYEPFMYLSVPLPNAMERQFEITYVPASSDPPIKCLVSINKQSKIIKLKEELLKTLDKEDMLISNIALAEVYEEHISRILEDNSPLKYIDDTNRKIYAFELIDPTGAWTNSSENASDQPNEKGVCSNGISTSTSEEIPGQCTICLDEVDGQLFKHDTDNCNFIMCENCIENYFKTSSLKCSTCSTQMDSSSFVKVEEPKPRPAARILNVPFILRCDPSTDAPNNCKGNQIFGHPHLLRITSVINVQDLYEMVKNLVPQEQDYILRFVNGQGGRCSRCLFPDHCTGCKLPESGTVTFRAKDTLAVCYVDKQPISLEVINHSSLSKQCRRQPLSLYDCLQAFSQSEQLDEHNPWFCPKCERNQCATKTLTVYRYPKYLIVYLKRFVFHECVSMKLDDKVTFPLVGLSVGQSLYDLYACVCHYGGVSAGHYTAYAKNPKTDVWYLYNDEIISKQKPQEEDFGNAYILFYSRQGTNMKSCNI